MRRVRGRSAPGPFRLPQPHVVPLLYTAEVLVLTSLLFLRVWRRGSRREIALDVFVFLCNSSNTQLQRQRRHHHHHHQQQQQRPQREKGVLLRVWSRLEELCCPKPARGDQQSWAQHARPLQRAPRHLAASLVPTVGFLE